MWQNYKNNVFLILLKCLQLSSCSICMCIWGCVEQKRNKVLVRGSLRDVVIECIPRRTKVCNRGMLINPIACRREFIHVSSHHNFHQFQGWLVILIIGQRSYGIMLILIRLQEKKVFSRFLWINLFSTVACWRSCHNILSLFMVSLI